MPRTTKDTKYTMTLHKKIRSTIFILSTLMSLPSISFATESTFVTIGTGGVTGVYYPAGGAICRLMNKGKKQHNIRCSVESTGGSIYNLNSIRSGELDVGVAQSDWQYYALNGHSKFADKGKFNNLRSLFALHSEAFTVVARKDANIHTFEDLKNKRVNIGNPGSGQRATIDILLKEMGWTTDDFTLSSELKASEQSTALCDNKVDAIVFFAGHPNASIKEATTACDANLVHVNNTAVDSLIKKYAYYAKSVVPEKMYGDSTKDTYTFGVRATLVTSTDLPEGVAYTLVKSVFENLRTFKRLHPAFSHLTKEDMATSGLSAPLHKGAEKYYREIGLIQ